MSLPQLDVMCAACLSSAQVLEGGTLDDHPEFVAAVRNQDFGGRVEVIWKGQGLCLRHFNIDRHWPADYPNEPMPDELKAELIGRYETFLAGDTDGQPDGR